MLEPSLGAMVGVAWQMVASSDLTFPAVAGRRSRLMRVPRVQRPAVVTASVSADASAANVVRPSCAPTATTVRHAPAHAIDAPSASDARS